MSEYLIKPVDDLEFTDDFMFGTVMQDETICKGVLERLLKTKISKVEYPKLQKSIAPYYEAKGIRLDVYVESDDKVYDIEIQCKKLKALEKRVRYYQSMIDVDNLCRGVNYSELKESFVIFICKTDPFGFKSPSYEVKSKIVGKVINEKGKVVKITKPYDDKTHKIFFNAQSYEVENNKDLKALLNFCCNNKSTDNFTKNLEDRIMELKTQDKFRNDYFAFNIHEQDLRDEGRAEGRLEGRELQRLEDEKIIAMISKQKDDEILKYSSENKRFASENAKYASEVEKQAFEIQRLRNELKKLQSK